MAKRVHQLAKELGVKSTAIVDKCKAEGLAVKNHMSTLSAGLEATIREWFSAGEHNLTVETTARVDLDKVKAKPKRSRKKKAAEGEAPPDEIAPAETAVATAVAPPEAETSTEADTVVETEAPALATETDSEAAAAAATEVETSFEAARPKRLSPKELAAVETTPTEAPAPLEPAAEVTTPEAPAPDVAAEPATPAAEHADAPTDEPAPSEQPAAEESPAEPAGPEVRMAPGMAPVAKDEPAATTPTAASYVPEPAKLQGPKVIRVERPDVVAAPPRAPRRPLGPRPGGPGGPGGPQTPPPETGAGKKGRKRRHGEPVVDDPDVRKAKQRQQQKRRGRRYESQSTLPTHALGGRDWQERQERLAAASGNKLRGRQRRMQEGASTGHRPGHQKITEATVKEPITVKDLSAAIGVRANEIIGKLMGMGVMAALNQTIETEAAQTIALEFGVELTVEEKTLLLDELGKEFETMETSAEDMGPRAPVVAFLGHVDHGKTSLLDYIRKANVVSGEAGGITQHIGSYLYDDGDRRVAFLDTPGHAAFTAMRARGANMTDIVVLVVAADDGVMPQTEEAINHAKASGVSIVVALNKIDLPNADENRALGQLAEHQLVPTMWGGDTEVVRTSATTGEGLADLVEHLDYIAELNDLKARTTGPATGYVVESEMTTAQGALARMLVSDGTLNPGDVVVSGCSYGKVRTLADATGMKLLEAGPATPVEITGLDTPPVAGDRFFVVDEITRAKAIAEEQQIRQREQTLAQRRQVTLENLFTEIAAGELKELNVIIKADVQGSVDVLRKSVMEMNTDEVAVKILHAAVGGISESDVLLAEASNAIIIGFQVIADDHAKTLAERSGVEIRLYRVIYQISEDIKKALEGMLAPRVEEKQMGAAEVRDTFRISRLGVIAGCYVTEGAIQRNSKVRVVRSGIVLRDNLAIDSLKRVKDDASEVKSGLECGIKLTGFDDIEVGDRIEAFELIEVSRTLDSPNA